VRCGGQAWALQLRSGTVDGRDLRPADHDARSARQRLAPHRAFVTFPRVTRPLLPRANSATTPERRALQDALAWPIALTLLVGAAIVFFLPRVVPPQFLTVAVGAVFALVTIALVVILSALVERWLRRHAHDLAVQAERQVQTVGIAGLPTATGDSALVPLASAYADAGARAALTSAERETGELLARLGVDALDSAASDHLPVVIDITCPSCNLE
jgi:membrane protein implicated in regulation of membrane protease activity